MSWMAPDPGSFEYEAYVRPHEERIAELEVELAAYRALGLTPAALAGAAALVPVAWHGYGRGSVTCWELVLVDGSGHALAEIERTDQGWRPKLRAEYIAPRSDLALAVAALGAALGVTLPVPGEGE